MRIFFISFFTLISFVAVSQRPDSLKFAHRPAHALKWSPIHLWGFYPSLQLAYEVGFAKRLSAQADAGYVVRYDEGTSTDYMNKRGVKLKAELRYYFESLAGGMDGFYASVEPYMTSINFDRSVTLSECFDPACQHTFWRNYTYKVEYREMGLSAKGGYIIYFDKNILLDVNIGWSLRSINYDQPDNVPELAPVGGFNFFAPNEEDRIILSPLFGARIGYRFR